LEERPHGDEQDEQGIDRHGKSLDGFRCQAAYAGQKDPAEEYQGDGDLIPVKLRQKFSDGQQLSRYGGYARTDDRPYDQAFMIHHMSILTDS